jgi:hypothetical protein
MRPAEQQMLPQGRQLANRPQQERLLVLGYSQQAREQVQEREREQEQVKARGQPLVRVRRSHLLLYRFRLPCAFLCLFDSVPIRFGLPSGDQVRHFDEHRQAENLPECLHRGH